MVLLSRPSFTFTQLSVIPCQMYCDILHVKCTHIHLLYNSAYTHKQTFSFYLLRVACSVYCKYTLIVMRRTFTLAVFVSPKLCMVILQLYTNILGYSASKSHLGCFSAMLCSVGFSYHLSIFCHKLDIIILFRHWKVVE